MEIKLIICLYATLPLVSLLRQMPCSAIYLTEVIVFVVVVIILVEEVVIERESNFRLFMTIRCTATSMAGPSVVKGTATLIMSMFYQKELYKP